MVFNIFNTIANRECQSIINLMKILIPSLELFYVCSQMTVDKTNGRFIKLQSYSNTTFVALLIETCH